VRAGQEPITQVPVMPVSNPRRVALGDSIVWMTRSRHAARSPIGSTSSSSATRRKIWPDSTSRMRSTQRRRAGRCCSRPSLRLMFSRRPWR